MANNAVKISDLAACTNPQSTDLLVLSSNVSGNTISLSVSTNNLFNNTSANLSINVATTATLVVTGNGTPANNTDNDSRANGAIWSDGNYIYYWNGTEIKRAALSTF